MVRYKGRSSHSGVVRHFPHSVEMIVPPGGFRRRLDDMYAFLSSRGIRHEHGRGRREGEQDVVVWRFADADSAAAFAREFDGRLMKGDSSR